jgi:heme/copper-type cytochrome/quinol oxidase subunit 2
MLDLFNIILRLLETDNFLIVPIKSYLHFLVTSDDVIHSFALTNLGVKMDCVPGRLNETTIYIKREGFYIGQCSEICGINHAYMPINILSLSQYEFLNLIYYYLKQSNKSNNLI